TIAHTSSIHSTAKGTIPISHRGKRRKYSTKEYLEQSAAFESLDVYNPRLETITQNRSCSHFFSCADSHWRTYPQRSLPCFRFCFLQRAPRTASSEKSYCDSTTCGF